MTFDPTENRIPFGLLTKEEQEALKAWPHGLKMYHEANYWIPRETQGPFADHVVYRGKPAPLVPDYINWDHVSPEFVCMARDADGDVYLYAGAADISGSLWSSEHDHTSARAFASYRKGTVQWVESLVWRPGYEPK